jgi:hypothetical protein
MNSNELFDWCFQQRFCTFSTLNVSVTESHACNEECTQYVEAIRTLIYANVLLTDIATRSYNVSSMLE